MPVNDKKIDSSVYKLNNYLTLYLVLLFHSTSFYFICFGRAELIASSHLRFPFFSPFSHTGRLLDTTKNYKYIFLLAGSEVFLSALVLGISNFLCMRKKSPPSLEDPADGAKMEMCGEALEMTREEDEEEDDTGAKDVAKEEVKAGERGEEGEEVAAVDSQEEEKFLKKPQLNGEASNSETRL